MHFNREEKKKFSRLREILETLNQAQQKGGVASQEPWILLRLWLWMWRSSSFFMVGRLKWIRNLVQKGTLSLWQTTCHKFLVELVKFANLVVTMTKSVASAERIDNILAIRQILQWRNRKKVLHQKEVVAFQWRHCLCQEIKMQRSSQHFIYCNERSPNHRRYRGLAKSVLWIWFLVSMVRQKLVFGVTFTDYRFASLMGLLE